MLHAVLPPGWTRRDERCRRKFNGGGGGGGGGGSSNLKEEIKSKYQLCNNVKKLLTT